MCIRDRERASSFFFPAFSGLMPYSVASMALACRERETACLKKYKVTINDLLAENEKLEARAKASEKGKMKDTMERAKLESELKDIQRLVDRIPPEVLAELKRQQRHTRER